MLVVHKGNRQVHKQHSRYKSVLLVLLKQWAMGVQNYILRIDSKVIAEKIKKRMYCKGQYAGKISSSRPKDGELFQRVLSGTLRQEQEHRS
jgi:hypothetical protein